MKRLVSALRNRGVKEIHLRSSSPPLRHPCYFGIDIPKEAELIAAGRSVQEVADYIGVDSLGYLSLPGLERAINSAAAQPLPIADNEAAVNMLRREFCYGCMQQEGWPFNPTREKMSGAQPLHFVTRDALTRKN